MEKVKELQQWKLFEFGIQCRGGFVWHNYSRGAGPCGRAVLGVGLRPLACWECGFESHRGHGCLSLVIVVYCQVEVSATGGVLSTVVRR